jgi:amino acid transporter/nucleotide-binding universal stress UspA family protein
MSGLPPVKAELSRDLSLFHITMMGLGMMIGAGVFIGIGMAVGKAGPGGVLLTFALNGVVAVLTAMSFAELSSAVPRAGGAYNFARIAFGRGPSFLAGWMEWFASSVAGSLYAVVFATYTLDFVLRGLLGLDPAPATMRVAIHVLAVAAALAFLFINYRGASETGKVGALFALGQMVFVGLIGAAGVVVAVARPGRLANFEPFLPHGWGVLLATMGFIYVAFEGFEVIAQAGDETVDPKRNIPKAMLYSVLIVTVTYVAVSFATVVAVEPGKDGVGPVVWEWIGSQGPNADGERGFGEAVKRLFPFGGVLVTLAVLFSSTSALNATVYSAARASYALGRDRLLPERFARISKRRRTPHVALAATGVILLLVAGLLPTKDVASCASMMFLFLFFLVNVCVVRIRLNMGDELTYGYVMPLFPLPPILAVAAQGVLAVFIVHMSVTAWIIAPAWVLAGVVIYFAYGRSHAAATADEIRVLEEERAPPGDEYRIMVAVANPSNAVELVRNTYRLCAAKKARVELLNMVPVPDQVPLTDAEKVEALKLPGQESIVEQMLYLAPQFPFSSTLRYCRNVARGIVSAVREKKIDLLIMGWHGYPKTHAFQFGSTVDPVIERAPCSVAVFKDCGGDRKFRRVLVPLAGGPNGAFALEIASILAEPDDGVVVAMTAGSQEMAFDLRGFVDEHAADLHLPRQRIETRTVATANVVDAILDQAARHDLVVIGATREPLLYHLARPSVPETVALECPKPLVMVRASGGIRSWIKRWV